MKNQKGFTLLEILVAVSIIIVLVSIGVSSYASVSRRSRDARRVNDLEQIRSALEMYRAENGYYPNIGNGAWTNVSNLRNFLVPTYMQRIPSDPRDAIHPYQYRAMNPFTGNYYGYCLSTRLETETRENNCGTGISLPNTNYNYGVRHP